MYFFTFFVAFLENMNFSDAYKVAMNFHFKIALKFPCKAI